MKKWRQILPWTLLILLFYFLFSKIPPADVLETTQSANFIRLIIFSAGYFTAILFVDSMGLRWALSRFVTPIGFKEALLMRGATYSLMILNYNVAQGGIAFYLNRTHNAPIFKTLGTIFYITLIDLSILAGCGLVAILNADVIYRDIRLNPYILQAVSLFFLGLILWILFWRNLNSPAIRWCERYKFFKWLTAKHIFHTFKESTARDYLNLYLRRIPMVVSAVSSIYLCFDVFFSTVPWSDILLYTPIIFLIGSLPITPGGMGTVQALAVEFLSPTLSTSLPYSPDKIIFSATLVWGFANLFYKFLFGSYCLHKKSATLFSSPSSK